MNEKEQIELIRKDLNSLYKYRQDNWNYIGCHNQIVGHLNAIEEMSQNTLKYKTAWEELKQDCKEVEKDDDCVLFSRLDELEQKHGIGVE